MAEDSYVVTPWDVKGDIDYKLIISLPEEKRESKEYSERPALLGLNSLILDLQ